jgi:hypothetical protein
MYNLIFGGGKKYKKTKKECTVMPKKFLVAMENQMLLVKASVAMQANCCLR